MRSFWSFLVLVCPVLVVGQVPLDRSGLYEQDTRGFALDSEVFVGPMGGIVLEQLSGERYALLLTVCRGWPGYNLGVLEDTVVISSDSLVLRSAEDSTCLFMFRFSPDRIQVEQRQADLNMGCGFGHGVFADGVYRRTVDGRSWPAWYDTVQVDCLAPLRTVALHHAALTPADMDLLCNAFHPACKDHAAFLERVDELYHAALRPDPAAFIRSLDRAEAYWQVPYVLYVLSVHALDDGVDEALRDQVMAASTSNDWLQQRIVQALEGSFE
jgi:hypothetical protein